MFDLPSSLIVGVIKRFYQPSDGGFNFSSNYKGAVSKNLIDRVCNSRRELAEKVANTIISNEQEDLLFLSLVEGGLFHKEAGKSEKNPAESVGGTYKTFKQYRLGFPDFLARMLAKYLPSDYFSKPEVIRSFKNQSFDKIVRKLHQSLGRDILTKINRVLGLTDVLIYRKGDRRKEFVTGFTFENVADQIKDKDIISKFIDELPDESKKKLEERYEKEEIGDRDEFYKEWFKKRYSIIKRDTKLAEEDQIALGKTRAEQEDMVIDALTNMMSSYYDHPENLAKVLTIADTTESKGTEDSSRSHETPSSAFGITLFKPVEEEIKTTIKDPSGKGRNLSISRGYKKHKKERLDPNISRILDEHLKYDKSMVFKKVNLPEKGIKIEYKQVETLPGAGGQTRNVFNFTLPETGDPSRVFQVELPPGMIIRDEDTAFEVVGKQEGGYDSFTGNYRDEGYLIQFITEKTRRENSKIEAIKEKGLKPNELNRLYDAMATNFSKWFVLPYRISDFGDFIQKKLDGKLYIKGESISDLDDLADLIEEEKEKILELRKEKGFSLGDRVKEDYERYKKDEELKATEMEELYGEDIAKVLSKYDKEIEKRSNAYARSIASKFPEDPKYTSDNLDTFNLTNALSTKTFIEDVLGHIMTNALKELSVNTKKTKSPEERAEQIKRGIPWKLLEESLLKSEDLKNPEKFRKLFDSKNYYDVMRDLYAFILYDKSTQNMSIEKKRKQAAKIIAHIYGRSSQYLSPEDSRNIKFNWKLDQNSINEISDYLKSVDSTTFIKLFNTINEKIIEAVKKAYEDKDPLITYLMGKATPGMRAKLTEPSEIEEKIDEKSNELEQALLNKDEKALDIAQEVIGLRRDITLLYRTKGDLSQFPKALDKIDKIVKKYESKLRDKEKKKQTKALRGKKKKEPGRVKGVKTPEQKEQTFKTIKFASELYRYILNYEFKS